MQPYGWFLSKMCRDFRQLGVRCIALVQEEIEVAALVGLEYGIFK
jgi:hypothetical protein